jgi:hypothetical protein
MALSHPSRPLPLWLRVGVSLIVVGHLSIIGLNALAAPSGPWTYNIGTSSGVSDAPGPVFAKSISENVSARYLHALRMTHNYHFATNKPNEFAVYFEVHLKNDMGDVRVLKFPDEKANAWVRHRQEILAQNLVPDMVRPPRGNKRVAPKGQESPKVEVFVPEAPLVIRLKLVDENDDIFSNPQDQPSPWTKALVQSYLRYLCRENNVPTAELVRYSRRTVLPSDLYAPRPADIFMELKSYFGVYRREQ